MYKQTSTIRTLLAAIAVATCILAFLAPTYGEELRGEAPPAAAEPAHAAPGGPLPGGQAPGAAADVPGDGGAVNPDNLQAPAHGNDEGPFQWDWDSLSQQLIPRLAAANHTMTDMIVKFRAAHCLVDITVGGKGMTSARGRYYFGWEDGDEDKQIVDAETKLVQRSLSNRMAMPMMVGPENRLQLQFAGCMLAMFQESKVRTQRSSTGFTMTVSPKTGTLDRGSQTLVLTISRDLRIPAMEIRNLRGVTMHVQFAHRNVGGRWLTTGCTKQLVFRMQRITTSERYTYRWIDGVAVPAEIYSNRTLTGLGARVSNYTRYTYGKWQVEKRQAPAEVTNVPPEQNGRQVRTPEHEGPARNQGTQPQLPDEEALRLLMRHAGVPERQTTGD